MTVRQAVCMVEGLDREHLYDMAASQGVSRASVDAKIASSEGLSDVQRKAVWEDICNG